MNKSRIYTKLGDDGTTGLLFGGRISKANLLIETIGNIDETVAMLGLARANTTLKKQTEIILKIQRDLFVVNADLISNPNSRDRLVPEISLVTPKMVSQIEAIIDELLAKKPLKPIFVVPGANTVSATLDLARTIVRRAERSLVAYKNTVEEPQAININASNYLNRVSDLIYVLARQVAGNKEEPFSH